VHTVLRKQGFPVTLAWHSHHPEIACWTQRQTLDYWTLRFGRYYSWEVASERSANIKDPRLAGGLRAPRGVWRSFNLRYLKLRVGPNSQAYFTTAVIAHNPLSVR
jgi:hypothetical protein